MICLGVIAECWLRHRNSRSRALGPANIEQPVSLFIEEYDAYLGTEHRVGTPADEQLPVMYDDVEVEPFDFCAAAPVSLLRVEKLLGSIRRVTERVDAVAALEPFLWDSTAAH